MPNPKIREATAEDADGVAALVNNVLREQFDRATIPDLTPVAARAIERDGHWYFVAMDGEKIVGYCALHRVPFLLMGGDEGYLSELFIDGGQRGGGIGGALLDKAVATAKAQGFQRLRLINMRNRDSYKRGFYTKRGWRERPDGADFVLDLTDD
ncbi:MAG: GNAT family N-acetyltransferase [Alphaproteobacteria bacterium]|nr:GNAT family N-acetyltransferase [Alphaproteobacteria bacterium]